ncbi:MAG: hypothetical protein RL077_1816 [Verrucomicrobiota bacterium]
MESRGDFLPTTDGAERAGDDQRERDEAGVGVFGLDKLGGLRDIFPEDELGLNRGPEAEVREDLLRGAAVRGVRRVRDREFIYEGVLNNGARIVEIKILARGPEDEPAERVRSEGSGVGVLGRDESVRVAEIGGEKDIVGRAVGDLRA